MIVFKIPFYRNVLLEAIVNNRSNFLISSFLGSFIDFSTDVI